MPHDIIHNELAVLERLLPARPLHILELGCGKASLARQLLAAQPAHQYTGLEVDRTQHQQNLAQPQTGMQFALAGAQAIPAEHQQYDLVLMLKSLHHVPVADMDQALGEIARVTRGGGLLYVSEPVYAGPLNDIVRLYNDEGTVRAAAQAALDRALQTGQWQQTICYQFNMPVHFDSFDAFETRMMRPTFADHQLDEDKVGRVRAAFAPYCSANGADFMRPMLVRCLQKQAD